MWEDITYPFTNSPGTTVEVWEWIGNFIHVWLCLWLRIHAWVKVNPFLVKPVILPGVWPEIWGCHLFWRCPRGGLFIVVVGNRVCLMLKAYVSQRAGPIFSYHSETATPIKRLGLTVLINVWTKNYVLRWNSQTKWQQYHPTGISLNCVAKATVIINWSAWIANNTIKFANKKQAVQSIIWRQNCHQYI